MCGFVVVLRRDGGPVERNSLEHMMQTLQHRGPDDSGVYLDKNIGMAFRRLAILDLTDAGHQPMVAEGESAVLVFNGEIFNYIELRQELESLGHSFRSTGDAEVLLKSYLQWGEKCPEKLNGEWAFLVYDKRRQKLFGSRDRFAIKPLYRVETKNEVVWASEIKSILKLSSYNRAINWTTVADYFAGGRIDHRNETFFEGIESVPAAHAFQADLQGGQRSWRYWSLPAQQKPSLANDDVAEEFAEIFEDSVALRLRSDVPVAVCLSGGLDSTGIICAMARQRRVEAEGSRPIDAFSYHHNDYDESTYIDATLKQTGAELHSLEMDQSRLWDMTSKILEYQDEPVHSLTAMVGFQLMKLISDAGIRVVLNGQGADEAFAGYERYFQDTWCSTIRRGRIMQAWGDIGEYAAANGGDAKQIFASALIRTLKSYLRMIGPYRRLSRLRTKREFAAHPWFENRLLEAGRFPYPASVTLPHVLERAVEEDPLPLYLRVEDRNSMANSVEVRLPWLDYRLVEFGFRLPDRWKIRGSLNKYIVRASARGRIPDVVQQRVDKMGFPVGMQTLLNSAATASMAEIISSSKSRERGIFDTDRIVRDIRNNENRNNIDIAYDAFRVAQFELWAQMFDM